MATMKNPQSKPINQKQGPRNGNAGNTEKRMTFMEEKSKTGSQRAALADVVTRALEGRGRGQRGKDDASLESLHDTTNVGRGPTKGNSGKRK
jgi:hypothetical protein